MTTETTSSSIVVRSYQPSDLSACQEIFTAAYPDLPMFYINYILRTNMADIEKKYLQIPNGHWWVAVNDNRVVGQIAVLPLHIAAPSYYHELPEGQRGQICELLRLAVASDVQGEGIGSKLLSTLIDFARGKGYCQVHLTTLVSMNKACAFYEKNGFIKGRIDRLPFDDLSREKFEDIHKILSNLPKPVIFELDAIIPDEDLRLMKMPPIQSKLKYVQHYSLML